MEDYDYFSRVKPQRSGRPEHGAYTDEGLKEAVAKLQKRGLKFTRADVAREMRINESVFSRLMKSDEKKRTLLDSLLANSSHQHG